jgi:16S rRNA (adenine1518-N6/adenine1519-N6)-dimethyltransferase
MYTVRAKKHLGQHFLNDQNIARKIAGSLHPSFKQVIEVGPGTGVLTKYLLENPDLYFKAIDIDAEAIAWLKQNYPESAEKFILADFLNIDISTLFPPNPIALIGNFPYNISSQIFFKIIDNRNLIGEVVGMVQKEVAERIAAPPGSKTYGILSVLLQAWYDIDYLFTVSENVFTPPPKVKSAVIKLRRNTNQQLPCDERLFKIVVKTAFNQRRKTLRNALSGIIQGKDAAELPFMSLRAERLSVADFALLTASLQ